MVYQRSGGSPFKHCFVLIFIHLWARSFCQTFIRPEQEKFARSLNDFQYAYPTLRIYKQNRMLDVSFEDIRTTRPNKFYAIIEIPGKRFTLKLRRNRRLVNKEFDVETEGLPGTQRLSRMHCHYIGRVLEHRHSKAAISACGGLKGFIKVQDDVLFIEPMKKELNSYPHLLYYSKEEFNSTYGMAHSKEVSKHDVGYTCHAERTTDRSEFEKSEQKLEDKIILNGAALSGRRKRRRNEVDMLAADVNVFVVVDTDMVAFHGNDSLHEYILTMMNMVADLYKDRALGALVNIVVAKILILGDKQDDLSISHHGDKTLRSFCDWQYSRVWYSGKEKKRILKYDVAILITRKDVCVNRNAPCGTIGMAYIGGVCKPRRKCSVIEDIGLNTAFTIAHELGHSFGMVHDGEDNSCNMNNDGVPHMMSSRWPDENQVGALKWSRCSRDVLVDFLSSYRSLCLRPQPGAVYKAKVLSDRSFMPGTIYDADQQCRQQYGTLARHCKYYKTTGRPTDMCKQLWCELDGVDECFSKLDPVAKGTPCGHGKWCMYGNCINNNTIPDKVDGGWSEWNNWTNCSRKCGVGVSTRSRRCNNPPAINGGRYCEGESRRYKTCNTQPCSSDQSDPRSQQCAEFDNDTISWIPVTSNRNPCGLYCRPKQDSLHVAVLFAPKVVDGTPCRTGSKDICVDGQCQQLGCDFQLNSELTRDICGVCGGNGTTCNVVEGEFTQQSGEGYVTAVVIPEGAQNVVVKEEKPCASFLALKSGVGTYHINGNWKIELPGEFNVNGTIVYYQREGTQEMLYTEGPTKAPLHIMVLFQDFNLGVKYRYTVPLVNETEKTTRIVRNSRKSSFGWIKGAWGPCSVVCGGGLKKRKEAQCIKFAQSNVSAVDEKFCSGARKPKSEERTCHEQKCALTWAVSSWSPCSRTCGVGRQKRDARCVGQKKDGRWEFRPVKDCPKNKPITVQSCVYKACYLSWQVGQWSRCRAGCGRKGITYRQVECPFKNACSARNKPSRMRICQSPSCKYHWIASSWSKCSASCGEGVQTRKVTCFEDTSGKSRPGYCSPKNRPEGTRLCLAAPCPTVLPLNVGDTRELTNLKSKSEFIGSKEMFALTKGSLSTRKKLKKVKKKEREKDDDCQIDLLGTWTCKKLVTKYFCANDKRRRRCCVACREYKFHASD